MGRKISLMISVAVGVAGALAALAFIRPQVEGDELLQAAKEQLHTRKALAIEVLGPPETTYAGHEYNGIRSKIAVSYDPDPPVADCDEVLVYRTGVRIVLLFIDDGRVARMYSGLT